MITPRRAGATMSACWRKTHVRNASTGSWCREAAWQDADDRLLQRGQGLMEVPKADLPAHPYKYLLTMTDNEKTATTLSGTPSNTTSPNGTTKPATDQKDNTTSRT